MKKTSILLTVLILISCTQNPITGRKQLTLMPESQMSQMGLTNYQTFLTENSTKVMATGANVDLVKKVGNKLAVAVEAYMKQINQQARLANYNWEFNVVNENVANAWCMPGGKVVVYTGLLPITQTESGLAVVMGHEIAHAIASHGNERMSRGMIQEMGGMALEIALANKPDATKNMFLNAFGVGSEVGIMLPFSRMQETEADKMGLIFMALAGYNPNEAVPFWQRMEANSGGKTTPPLLSTHPSDAKRISDITAYLPEAMKYYKPI